MMMKIAMIFVLLLALAVPARPAVDFDGSNDYATATTTEVTAVAFSVCCYVNPEDSGTRAAMSFGDTAGNSNWFKVGQDNTGATAITYAGTQARAVSPTGITTNVWVPICGVFTAINDRSAFTNGGSEGTNSTSQTPAGVDSTGLAVLVRSSNIESWKGDLAECGVWDVALADAEVEQFADKFSPRCIRPSDLIGYYPLVTVEDGVTLHDFASDTSTNLTIASTPTSDSHPRVTQCN